MSSSWSAFAGTAAAAGLVGLALGSWLGTPEPPAASEAPPQLGPPLQTEEIAELKRQLDLERGRTGALELELALLQREIAPPAAAPVAPPDAAAAKEPAAEGNEAEAARKPPDTKPAHSDWFDASKLTAIGVGERHAEDLRERFEELQMDELYLRDQATRGRWLRKPRYSIALRELRDEARAEIGNDDYDRMLYASGRHNRVLLSDVLQSSPAALAGVQAGDVLVRYGDRPIFDVRDLLAETTSGKLGQTESIDVERDGELLRFYVERGPLGAKIQPMRRAPAALP